MGIKAQSEARGRRILLGDNIGGGTVVLRPIGFLSAVFWISTGLPLYTYRVSHELRSLLRESVPYFKIYRYDPKHLYPKLNCYGDNGKRSLKVWQLLHTY